MSKIASCHLQLGVAEHGETELRECTPEELESIAFPGPEITLVGGKLGGSSSVCRPTSAAGFTVAELAQNISRFEHGRRNNSDKCIAGVDDYRIFLRGLKLLPGTNNRFAVGWLNRA